VNPSKKSLTWITVKDSVRTTQWTLFVSVG